MAEISYADSGAGWLADKQYYRSKPSHISTVNGREYHTIHDGPIIFATVCNGIGNTGPVVISTDETITAYDQGNTHSQGSFLYKGYTWYITAFSSWFVGDYPDDSGISQKMTIASTDYAVIGQAVLEAAGILRTEDLFPNMVKIYYNGKSKVIRRICELLNQYAKIGTSHDEAFYGDWGQEAYDHSQLTSGNPHNVSLTELGIADVPEKVAALWEALGSTGYWMTHDTEDTYITDHEGNYIEFRGISNFLAWH